ncbi:protein kinase family protein, partial [Reticulomyxa filosa]
MSWQEESLGDSLLMNPEEFLCPITKELMVQPTILVADGTTYEESALKDWLSEHNTSPLTGLELHTKETKPNYNLRQAIESYTKYVSEHKELKRKFEEELNKAKTQKNKRDNDDNDDDDNDNSNNETDANADKKDNDDEKKEHEMLRFLQSNHLDKYFDTLTKEGFQTMDDLKRMTFTDLIAMNIPRGHARRLLQQLLVLSQITDATNNP